MPPPFGGSKIFPDRLLAGLLLQLPAMGQPLVDDAVIFRLRLGGVPLPLVVIDSVPSHHGLSARLVPSIGWDRHRYRGHGHVASLLVLRSGGIQHSSAR